MGMRHTRTDKQIELGQFFTTKNPFKNSQAFKEWYNQLPTQTYLEPFAGSGYLFNYIKGDWVGYDIEPKHPDIIQQNTLNNFPTGFSVCITNPPYLAKNVITRKRLNVSITHEDLYLDCLSKCLDNCDYVAAIIPSTFINQTKFHSRLSHFDKIDAKLFDSTDEPVCVAYFLPTTQNTKFYVNGEHVQPITLTTKNPSIQFNSLESNYTLFAIDSVKGNSIHVSKYSGETIKHSNRHIVPFKSEPLDLDKLNQAINQWRNQTNDLFLTSFKSLKHDGAYRKRMSFSQLNALVETL
jgi:hypothetical protein